jgi:hypothetical protein
MCRLSMDINTYLYGISSATPKIKVFALVLNFQRSQKSRQVSQMETLVQLPKYNSKFLMKFAFKDF